MRDRFSDKGTTEERVVARTKRIDLHGEDRSDSSVRSLAFYLDPS